MNWILCNIMFAFHYSCMVILYSMNFSLHIDNITKLIFEFLWLYMLTAIVDGDFCMYECNNSLHYMIMLTVAQKVDWIYLVP